VLAVRVGEGLRGRVPEPVVGLVLSQGQRLRILLANLTPAPQRVVVRGLVGEGRVHTLDARNAEQAMIAPEAFRAGAEERLPVVEGELTLRLLPYAVAWVDADAPERGLGVKRGAPGA
jgi:hypothetical protein